LPCNLSAGLPDDLNMKRSGLLEDRHHDLAALALDQQVNRSERECDVGELEEGQKGR